jgi:glycosyltransferase involved in cell wall biosynthesis
VFINTIFKYRQNLNRFKVVELIFEEKFPALEASIIIPVFNQENRIILNLMSIIENLGSKAEIIIINDGSEDDTDLVIRKFLKNYINKRANLQRIVYYSFKYCNFETMSDYFGVLQSRAKFIIEIQADMRLLHKNFDSQMIKTLSQNTDIFILSGRGITPFQDVFDAFSKSKGNEASINTNILKSIYFHIVRKRRNEPNVSKIEPETIDYQRIFPNSIDFAKSKRAGRLGRLIEQNIMHKENIFYVGETVMRGPICFSKERYENLGGFNINSFFLGFDEHDLNLRARQIYKWKAGYLPISFESPLENGSMRMKRSLKSRFELLLFTQKTNQNIKRSSLYMQHLKGGASYNDHEIRRVK